MDRVHNYELWGRGFKSLSGYQQQTRGAVQLRACGVQSVSGEHTERRVQFLGVDVGAYLFGSHL